MEPKKSSAERKRDKKRAWKAGNKVESKANRKWRQEFRAEAAREKYGSRGKPAPVVTKWL